MHLNQRAAFSIALGVLFAGIFASTPVLAASGPLVETVRQVEARLKARIGVAIYDEETGRNWQYNADDRFPMASTFKAFACAGVLARVDAGKENLNRSVAIRKSDLVSYSPVTKYGLGARGMTVAGIGEAAITMSENTAANLILDSRGGPKGFTEFMRTIGDGVTRLDRRETALNEAVPGDPRDTTTPNAIAKGLRALVLGDILSATSRKQLERWLLGNRVGDALLRAGLPKSWRIADKTGAGGHGSRSVIAIIWPPKRKPVIAAIYITETEASFDTRNAAIAEIGRAMKAALVD